MLKTEPGARDTRLKNGGKMRALAASQRSVRGEHPNRLRCDEIDEMDLKVLHSALGQIGPAAGVRGQVTLSSTWHNPDGTMTAMLAHAEEMGAPVYRWCWKETHESVGGWLAQQVVDDLRKTIPETMWKVEYNLQEPSAEGRVFSAETISRMFRKDLGETKGEIGRAMMAKDVTAPGQKYVFAHGTDIALVTDTTVINTLKCDERPVRLVAHVRLRGVEYSEQGRIHDERVKRLPGISYFDMTGVGMSFRSQIAADAVGFTFDPKSKARLAMEYVKACEDGLIVSPFIRKLYDEHRLLTWEALLGKDHTPDGVVSMMLAWRAARQMGVSQEMGGDGGGGMRFEGETRKSPWGVFDGQSGADYSADPDDEPGD
jgi:hypothetical protein